MGLGDILCCGSFLTESAGNIFIFFEFLSPQIDLSTSSDWTLQRLSIKNLRRVVVLEFKFHLGVILII